MAGGANPQQVATPAPVAATRPMPMRPAVPAQPNIFQQSAGAYTGAINAANAAAAYNPQVGYSPGSVGAQTAAGGINTYMNPYEQQVIDASMADLERQRLMQTNQIGAQATAANAFGGSRQGVAQALTNEAFANQGGMMAAQLRQQGFQTALGAAQQDAANRMQADIANQNARAQAAQFGQTAGLQAAQLRAAASGQLGGLAQQGFNMGQSLTQQQMQQGAMQQALNQALIDAGRAQYGGFTGAPAQSLSTLLASLGGANMGQQTETQSQRPGLLQYLTPFIGAR